MEGRTSETIGWPRAGAARKQLAMHDVASINKLVNGSSALVERAATSPEERHTPARADRPGSDRVELSDTTASSDPPAAESDALAQRIDDLRSRIATGNYLTPDKIETVVERLYQEVCGN